MTESKKSLIDQLLGNVEEVVKAAKRPLVKKRIKRSFETAIDNANDVKMDSEAELQDLRGQLITNPENADDILNAIIECKNTITSVEETVKVLEEEQKELFD